MQCETRTMFVGAQVREQLHGVGEAVLRAAAAVRQLPRDGGQPGGPRRRHLLQPAGHQAVEHAKVAGEAAADAGHLVLVACKAAAGSDRQ